MAPFSPSAPPSARPYSPDLPCGLRSSSLPWHEESWVLPHPSEPSVPPQPINQSASPRLLTPSAPPGTLSFQLHRAPLSHLRDLVSRRSTIATDFQAVCHKPPATWLHFSRSSLGLRLGLPVSPGLLVPLTQPGPLYPTTNYNLGSSLHHCSRGSPHGLMAISWVILRPSIPPWILPPSTPPWLLSFYAPPWFL
ncbi:hypothetical protein PO909_004634 [Leuciscus waleckii]